MTCEKIGGKRMLKKNVKNERKDYLDPTLDKYLRELDIRLGGKHEEKVEIAIGLINQNVSYEIISKITGLSISKIEELAKSNKDED